MSAAGLEARCLKRQLLAHQALQLVNLLTLRPVAASLTSPHLTREGVILSSRHQR